MPSDNPEGVRLSTEHIVREILQRCEPVAYFGKTPIYTSKVVPKEQLWFMSKRGGIKVVNLETDNA